MSHRSSSGQQLTRGVEAFFRPASGEVIEQIFERLEPFASQRPDITLPPAPRGKVSPRAMLVSSRDLRANKRELKPLDIHDELFIRGVIDRIPSLAEGRKVTAERARLHHKDGAHFLSLKLDGSSLADLHGDRDDIIDTLHAMSNTDNLDFGELDPEIHIARFGPTVPKSPVLHVASFIKRQLPFPVELAPVFDPNK